MSTPLVTESPLAHLHLWAKSLKFRGKNEYCFVIWIQKARYYIILWPDLAVCGDSYLASRPRTAVNLYDVEVASLICHVFHHVCHPLLLRQLSLLRCHGANNESGVIANASFEHYAAVQVSLCVNGISESTQPFCCKLCRQQACELGILGRSYTVP